MNIQLLQKLPQWHMLEVHMLTIHEKATRIVSLSVREKAQRSPLHPSILPDRREHCLGITGVTENPPGFPRLLNRDFQSA
jgi:hypothetical protein